MLEVQLLHLQSDGQSWGITPRGNQPCPASAWAALKDQNCFHTATGCLARPFRGLGRCCQPLLLLHTESSEVTPFPACFPIKDAL